MNETTVHQHPSLFRAPTSADALASASEQFGLGRPPGLPTGTDRPSPLAIRPWGLRRLVCPLPTPAVVRPGVRYDPVRQVLIDETGRPYLHGGDDDGDAPSAESVSDYDGDEGKSEDWKHDFAPDHPYVP